MNMLPNNNATSEWKTMSLCPIEVGQGLNVGTANIRRDISLNVILS